MSDHKDITKKFWKALKSDRTIMLGLKDGERVHPRPLTALIEGDEGGPIWIFTSRKTQLITELDAPTHVVATFSSKGHDIFASVHCRMTIDNDPAVIERLWSPFVSAWFKGGKDDPDLVLLRLDPSEAEIWVDASSLLAGIKLMLGIDPKDDYQDKVATVQL